MRIVEIFPSIQGEGINEGLPVVFIRTAACNFRCPFCDEKHTWNLTSGKSMSVDEIVEEVKKYHLPNVVITGGEPTLQIDELVKLIDKLGYEGKNVSIETNTSLPENLRRIKEENPYVHITCSPKLSYYPQAYKEGFMKDCDEVKLVIKDKEDLENQFKRLSDLGMDWRKDVVIMPLWEGDMEEYLKRCRELWELAVDINVRFTARLHTLIWNNDRKR